MCNMNGVKQNNEQINFNLNENFNVYDVLNKANSKPTDRTTSDEESSNVFIKRFPEDMRKCINVLLRHDMLHNNRFHQQNNFGCSVMPTDQNYDNYVRISNKIIAYYVANGTHNVDEYKLIFNFEYNPLFMRSDLLNRMTSPVLVRIVDELFDSYEPYAIVRLLCKLYYYNVNRLLDSKGINITSFDGVRDFTNDDYVVLLNIIDDIDRTVGGRALSDSQTLYSFVNYQFHTTLMSHGIPTFDLNEDMLPFIRDYIPLGEAIYHYMMPMSQGNIEDLSYLELLSRSVKSTIDLPSQIHQSVKGIADSTQNVSFCVDKMAGLTDSFVNFVRSFLERTTETAGQMSKDITMDIIEIFIDFVSDLPDFTQVSRLRWITYMSRILRLFVPNAMSVAINLFNTYFSMVRTAVAQGVDDIIQTLVVVLTGTIALQQIPDRPNVNKMMEYMKITNLSIPFSKNVITVLTSVFKMLPEMVKAWAISFVPEHLFYERLIDKYSKILDRIDFFLTLDLDKIYFSRELSKEFNTLYIGAHDLVKDMAPFARDNSGEFSLLREQLRKFDKLYDSFCAIQRCGVIRECPFSLTIYGDSQIGKSTLSSAIAKFMFPNVPSDRVRYVIPTDPEEFWNGYSPLHCVTAEDDADQDAEYKNALQLFSIVTNAPYQPPMASVDDHSIGVKGTPYHSKMHIRCTNNAYPNPSSKVLTVAAYWKRRHMLVHAQVKPEYIVDGKVQYCPLFKHLYFSLLDPMDPNSKQTPQEIGDLSDFLILLRRKYNEHMENEKRVMDLMTSTSDVFIDNLSVAYNNTSLLPDAQGRLTDMMFETAQELRIKATGTYTIIREYIEQNSTVARILKLLGVVAGIATTTVALITMYNSLFGEKQAIAEAIPSGDMRTLKYKKMKRPAYSEGTTDNTAESLVTEVVKGRQIYAEIDDRRTLKRNNMCGIFIGGRYALFPYHLFLASDGQLVEENSRFVLRTDQASFEQMFEAKRLTRLCTRKGESKDVAVYECTLQVRAWKDIRHHFISENDLAYIANWSDAALNKFNSGIFERQLVKITTITNQMYSVNGVITPYTIYKGFQYDAITVSGDCGSVLVVYNTRIVGKLLGIHVAGERNKHHGYTELVTSEMLDGFVPRIQPRSRPITIDERPAVILPEGNYTYYGTVPAAQAVYPVTRSEIKPSVIHGEIRKPTTAPVSLDKREFGETIARYFQPSMPINPKMKAILQQDANELNDALDSYKLGVVSEFEAINGNSKYKYFERMNMSTSPGLPYKKIGVGKGKERFFSKDVDGNYTVSDPTLRKLIDDRIAMAKKGIAIDSMWMDIPKDERRKPGKSTRMIVTPPLDYQIVFRMYFLDYIVSYYNSALKMHSAVGINPYSMDWTEMMNSLKANSDVGGDGDHTQFDGHMLTDFLEIDINAINHYYRYEANHDVSSLVREVLWYEMVHTPTQCVNIAYCVHCGVPSGCNCTTIINTNGNDKYYKLCWLGLAPPEMRDLKHYYENVKLYCYGDDSIASIKREVLSWYNLKAISEHLKIYNIKFTMADKAGDILEYKPLEECTFLKNGFRREGMIYHALMEENTLYEMVNWIRESDDDYYATVVNANMSLMMWYHYGVERFTLERAALYEALVKAGKQRNLIPHLLTYDYLDDCFRTDRVPVAEGTMETTPTPKDVAPPTRSMLSRLLGTTTIAEGEFEDFYTGQGIKRFYDDDRDFGQALLENDEQAYLFVRELMDIYSFEDNEDWFWSYFMAVYTKVKAVCYNYNTHVSANHVVLAAKHGLHGMTALNMSMFSKVINWFKNSFGFSTTAVAQGNGDQTAGEIDAANDKEETNVANAVTFIEQKPAVDIDKSSALNSNVDTMFGAWSLNRFFQKPQRVGTYKFTTTQLQGDVLKVISLPGVFFKIDQWANIVNTFTFMRYKPVIRVQLNGNKFCAGRLIVYGVPFSLTPTEIYPTTNKNMTGYTGFEHAFLDASSNDTCTLTLPWVYPREWMNIATQPLSSRTTISNLYMHSNSATVTPYNSAITHSFRIAVFNPLQVGTGAPTEINVTVFLHLEDMDICVPSVYKTSAQGGSQSYVTQNINNWEKVASQTLPTQIVGDKYDFKSDLKVSTMDKPNYTISPDYFVRRALGYMSHGVNIEHLERLALYPNGVSTANERDFGTSMDEMDLKYLTSKYTYYNSGTISTTDVTGTVLKYYPITPYILPSPTAQPAPLLTALNNQSWCPPGDHYQIPLLSYVSMPFNFWGGSLKYRFDFITNAFVTAKVYAAIIYGTYAANTVTTGIEPTSALGYTFEVNADNKTFEIDVPYVADTPWKRIAHGQVATSGGTTVNVSYDDFINDECCTGQIALYVVNPLSVPAGLPTSYTFNVFIAGGPDYRLNYVSRANTAWVPIAQGIDPNPGTDLSFLGQALYKTDMGVMSEVYTSIKDLLKRYHHVNTSFDKIGGAGTDISQMYTTSTVIPISSLITPFTSSNSFNINNASTVFNWYLALYRVWRGSLRFKICVELENETEGVQLVPNITVDYMPDTQRLFSGSRSEVMGANNESTGPNSSFSTTLKTIYNTTHHGPRSIANSGAPFVEIEVPFVYPNRVAPVPMTGPDGVANLDMALPPTNRSYTFANMTNNFGSLIINYPKLPNSYLCTTRIYMAAGDDFRVGCQVGQPLITYGGSNESSIPTSNYAVPPDFYN
ncbi:polyprotein [Biomphalaria virus 2]|uniref:polyprotein n=1 Tax=Biomphalaria virus 2 TaxID=1931370 RepID=UPI00097220B5|nr:polyprotein [Biomphalaria virus 2]APS85757.2 polyprotein [Biomphalaria virus 2]